MIGKTHFPHPNGDIEFGACGLTAHGDVTVEDEAVTCGRCRRTKAFADGAVALEDTRQGAPLVTSMPLELTMADAKMLENALRQTYFFGEAEMAMAYRIRMIYDDLVRLS